jgi:hypothetical protein
LFGVESASVDPEVLRVLTDPKAREDPARLRAAMSSMRDSARRAVVDSVRLNGAIMGGLGYALLAGGLGTGAAALAGVVPTEAGMAALLMSAIGALFAGFARMTALPPRSLLRNGTAFQAVVREVKALGRTIGIEKPGIRATLTKVTVVLSVPQPDGSNLDVEHREFIVGGDLARLQVGAAVPVRVDPKNPNRLAFDFDRLD